MICRRPRSVPRAVGLAFHEAVDDPALEILGARPLRQFETGVADRRRRCRRCRARRASPRARCGTGRRRRRLLPSSTICAWVSSTPEEQDATDEYRSRSLQICSACGIVISPSATAMPSAVVPLETPIESCTSQATSGGRASRRRAPNRSSAAASWSGRNAHPSGSADARHPASPPSRRRRPSRPSPGGRCPPAAVPRSARCRWPGATSTPGPVLPLRGEHRRMRRDDAVAAARPHHRDLVRSSASLRLPCFSSTRRNAWSARMRVKSLTPPLPSVLPITAMTSSAVNLPGRDPFLEAARILNGLQFDLRNFNRHRLDTPSCVLIDRFIACEAYARHAASFHNPRRDQSCRAWHFWPCSSRSCVARSRPRQSRAGRYHWRSRNRTP